MLCSVPLSDVKAKSPRWRFNISLLSNQTFITSLKEYIKEFLEINMPSDVDPQILWETTKCAIRGFCISLGSRQRGDIPGVTPFLVSHETHSSTFGFTGLRCSVHP